MAKKIKLICTRTNGRWNKGDVASFLPETAKKYLAAKDAAWKPADTGKAATPAKGAANNTNKSAAPTA